MPPAAPDPLDLLTALLADVPDLGIVSDPGRWEIVRRNARRHGLAPLVAWIARPHLDGDRRDWADRTLATSWSRHHKSLADLGAVLAVLEQAGVPCAVMKGPVLALRHYEPPFLRKPSSDIDLVVRDADLEAAVEALAPGGYRPASPLAEARARSHHAELAGSTESGTPSAAKSGGPGIELHFRLSHGAYGPPVEPFLARSVPYTLPGGRVVQVLSPADEIFHLVLHRAHGRFATLFHLYEIRRLWRGASPEVRAEVIQRAAEYHFAGAFSLTDAGFRVRWGEPFLTPDLHLPRSWLHNRIGPGLYADFERLSDPGRELPLTTRLARRWLDLQLTDRPADAARFLAVLARVASYQVRRRGWRTVRVGAAPE